MSKLNQFRDIERRIAEQMEELERLKQDKGLQADMAFEEDLKKLIKDYDMSLSQVINILDPSAHGLPALKQARKPRELKIYTHPDTGETIETKGGNHKGLKAWKEEFGEEMVESWRTQ